MTVLSLLNPLGWFSGGDTRYRAKLTEGRSDATGTLDPRGRPISAESALQVAAFWACVRIIAETIATLPLQIFRKNANGRRQAQSDHPLYALLHDQPNTDHTAMEFLEGLVAYVAVGGNTYVRKERIAGRLVALTLLRTPFVGVQRQADGSLGYTYTDRGVRETYTDDDIMHVRGFGFGDDVGLSALSYARRTLGIALAADEVVDTSFSNGMKMSGWFKFKGGNGILKPEQREQAKKVLIDPYVGAGNAAKVGILEGDFEWIAASMPMADAQLLESRRFGVEDVCRWLGVPPILIGHAAQGQTMWGSGVEQIMQGWLAIGLRPYLVRIEQAIKRSLFTAEDKAAGLYAEFNVDGLLRADSKARSENYSRLGQNGILTRNEMRALENLPPMRGGDQLTVQSNLVPIDKLGEIASLPRLKPVEPGSDAESPFKITIEQQQSTIMRLCELLDAKYSADQPRDAGGRFSSGGANAAPVQPTAILTRKGKITLGIVGVGVAALALDVLAHRNKPYRSHMSGYLAAGEGRAAVARLHDASVHTPISDAERAAVAHYTSDGFRNIQRKLRLGHKPTETVQNIDAAIGKSALAENIVVHRGINLDRSKRLLGKTQPGDVFVDRGYASTSLSEKVARDFASFAKGPGTDSHVGPDLAKQGYVMAINVDKGAQALPLPNTGFTTSSFLHEVLLPRGSAFKMLAVDHDTKTIHMQHLGVAVVKGGKAEEKTIVDLALWGSDDSDRFVTEDEHLEFYEAPEGDTTAADYVGYRPPQPRGVKTFDPNQPRDRGGQWSGSGGAGGGQGADDVWSQVASVAKTVAVGVALTAAAAAMVALAPELFALAGGLAAGEAALAAGATAAEAIAAATTAGRLAQATQLVQGAATGMYQTAAIKAGKAILGQIGFDTQRIDDEIRALEDLVKAAPGGTPGLADPRVRAAITDALATARDAMIDKLGGDLKTPGIPECRTAIRDAYRAFAAKLA